MNKQKPIYVDKLNSEDVIELTEYNGYQYNRYYFDVKDEKLYLFTRNKYKLIKPFNNDAAMGVYGRFFFAQKNKK